MSEENRVEKKLKDFSKEVDEEIPKYLASVSANGDNIEDALARLLAFEKKTRLAADQPSTLKLVKAILTLCKDKQKWKLLNQYIVLLCKRRAQLRKVIQVVIQDSCSFVELLEGEEKMTLIETIRTVSEGKMAVELERARLTRTLAEMKEANGDIKEAAELLQDVQVDTIGAMEIKEKCDFLLEQVRLSLERKDFVRAEIISKKVDVPTLDKEDFQTQKLKYWRQVITLAVQNEDTLAVSKAYQQIFRTPSIQEDEAQWKPALKSAVVYVLLSAFDSEMSDLLHQFLAEAKITQLPACKFLLDELTKPEVTVWPLGAEVQTDLKGDPAFGGEEGEKRWGDFHKRVVQHNMRVLAKYYTRLTSARLADMLSLSEQQAEDYLSEMVSSKQLFAKIDRPKGIVVFAEKQSPNALLNAWGSDISQLLTQVEHACHIINKENMMNGIVSGV